MYTTSNSNKFFSADVASAQMNSMPFPVSPRARQRLREAVMAEESQSTLRTAGSSSFSNNDKPLIRASPLSAFNRHSDVSGSGPDPMKATRLGGVFVAERMAQSSRCVSSS